MDTTAKGAGTSESVSAADQVRRPAGKRFIRVFLVLLILGAGGAAAWYWVRAQAYETTDDAFLEGRVIFVSPRVAGHVRTVQVTDNQEVRAGDLLVELDPADFEVRLQEARAGLAVALARERAAEKALAVVDVTSGAGLGEAEAAVVRARADVRTAEAAVQAAESRVAEVRALLGSAEARERQAEAEVEAAAAEARRAEGDWERYRALGEGGVATGQQVDQAASTARAAAARLAAAQKAADAARAEVARARAAEETARNELAKARTQRDQAEARLKEALSRLEGAKGAPQQVAESAARLEAAKAEVESARAAVRQAELELSYTRIVAPEAGRVTRKAVEPGMFVQRGQALLAVVPGDLWVVANFKETQITRMREGQRVDVRVDAYPDRTFRAHVDSFQSGTGARFSLLPPENATGNYVKVVQRVPVKICFDDSLPSELHLVPGLSVVPRVWVQ
ncbi:HlyD family secretion protein [Deferrisoma palaeochoriense]